MKLLIVRHGESEGNISSLVSAQDVPLTQEGKQQAQKLADKLQDTQIDLAFVSPLPRAQETADIVLKTHPETIIQSVPELRERSRGVYEGKEQSAYYQAFNSSGMPFGEFKPEGGESWYESGERTTQFIKSLMDQYGDSDKNIILIGHGSIFTYFLMYIDDQDPRANTKETYDHYHPKNTALSVIEVSPGSHRLHILNDISHLE